MRFTVAMLVPLLYIDPENGVDWLGDLMGNHDAYFDIDDDLNHLIDKDEFDWWHNLVTEYQAADNRYHDLYRRLQTDDNNTDLDTLETLKQNINAELEDYPWALNKVCDRFKT